MNKMHLGLAGVFLLQLAIAISVYGLKTTPSIEDRANQWIDINLNEMDRIEISQGSEVTTLARHDNYLWHLPDLDNQPVDLDYLNAVITQLNQLTLQWPVTTTKRSHQRFSVSEETHQRKLAFYQNDTLIQGIYIGSTPSFRQAHIRLFNNDAVYSVTLNPLNFPIDKHHWLDKSLLALDQVVKIKAPTFELVRQPDQWQLITNEEGVAIPSLDPQKAAKLVHQLETLQIEGVATSSFNLAEIDHFSIAVTDALNQQWHFTFAQRNNQFYIKRNDTDTLFQIAQPIFDLFNSLSIDSLLTDATTLEESPT